MTHALLEQLKRPALKFNAVKSELMGSVHGHAPITDEDEAEAVARFDQSRGYDLSRSERSKRAYALAEGAPIVMRRRSGHDPIVRGN